MIRYRWCERHNLISLDNKREDCLLTIEFKTLDEARQFAEAFYASGIERGEL